MTISSGVWFDTKNGKVVESEPEEGVQIVPPGSEMTAALTQDVQRYRDMETGATSAPGTIGVPAAVETATDETPVETAVETAKRAK